MKKFDHGIQKSELYLNNSILNFIFILIMLIFGSRRKHHRKRTWFDKIGDPYLKKKILKNVTHDNAFSHLHANDLHFHILSLVSKLSVIYWTDRYCQYCLWS